MKIGDVTFWDKSRFSITSTYFITVVYVIKNKRWAWEVSNWLDSLSVRKCSKKAAYTKVHHSLYNSHNIWKITFSSD